MRWNANLVVNLTFEELTTTVNFSIIDRLLMCWKLLTTTTREIQVVQVPSEVTEVVVCVEVIEKLLSCEYDNIFSIDK